MATTESKWITAISALIELTQRRELRWSTTPPGSVEVLFGRGFGAARSEIYYTKYKDRLFRLSKQPSTMTLGALATQPKANFLLEIVDDSGNVVFTVPETTGLADLFQAVQYQLAGVDEILESLVQAKKPPF